MKKWKTIALVAGLAAGAASAETVIDAWHFDGVVDGTALGDPSCASTGFVGGIKWPSRPMAVISNEMIYWEGTGSNTSFVTIEASDPRAVGATQGVFQLSYDVVSADFSNTAALDLDAGIGYGIRANNLDKVDADSQIRYIGSIETNVVEGVTNVVNHNEIELQASDDFIGSGVVMTNFSGATLSNVHFRAVLDFNNRGNTNSYEVYYTVNGGSEVLGYIGVLDPNMDSGQLRQSVAFGDSQPGDVVKIDNIILTMLVEPPPPPPPPALAGTFEEWLFNTETNGTLLNGVTNSAPEPYGDASWSVIKSYIYVTNSVLRYEQGGVNNFYAPLSQPGLTNGLFQIEYTYTAANISVRYGSVGFGMHDSVADVTAFDLILQYNSGLKLRARIGDTETDLVTFGVDTISNLSVRIVGNLDADTLDFYYTLGGEPEVTLTQGMAMAASGLMLDEALMAVQTKSTRFAATDYVEIDNLRFSVPSEADTPDSLYNDWLLENPTLVETDMTANPDSDAINNLYEYAQGGDPMDGTNIGNEPVFQTVDLNGTNYIEYVYAKATDADARGLTYGLETTLDLVFVPWTNANYTVTGTGSEAFAPGYDAVTNLISIADVQQFIRLQIEYVP